MNKSSFKLYQSSVYIFIFLIATIGALFYATNEGLHVNQSIFSFNREAIFNGEYWRLVTAHFLHTNFYHYLMNIIGLFLLFLLHFEYIKPVNFCALVLILCAATSICILWFSESIQSYVGLSGILHGIFAWGVVKDIQHQRKSGYLLLVGLLIKLIDEQFFSSSTYLSNLIEAKVAVDAHLYGAITGLILGLFSILLTHRYSKKFILKD